MIFSEINLKPKMSRKWAVSARTVESLETDSVEITLNEEGVSTNLFGEKTVRIGDHFQNLATLPMSEYPTVVMKIPKDVAKTSIKKKDLGHILPATTSDESGFKLSVIHFDADDNQGVATDGHRLHRVPAKVGGDSFRAPTFAAKILAALTDSDGSITFRVKDEAAFVKIDKAEFHIRLPDTAYPDYKSVVGTPAHTVTVKKAAMLKSLQQAALMASMSHRAMKVTFNGNIDMELQNPEKGTFVKESISCKGKIDPAVEMGLNAAYLVDIVKMAEKDDTDITIGITDSSSAVYMDHGDLKALVMPTRL